MTPRASQDRGEVVRRLIVEVLDGGRLDVADELMAPDVAERWKAWTQRRRDGSADVRTEIDLVVDGGDHVAVLVRTAGTHTGVLTGPYVDALTEDGRVEPTGRRFESRAALFFRFADGRVTSTVHVPDNMTLFLQLGVIGTGNGGEVDTV